MIDLTPKEAAFVERTNAVVPLVVESREEIEATRQLPKALVEAMEDAGVFQMYVPEELGGLCLRPFALIEAVMALAAADGSTGWNAMICGSQGLYLSRLAEKEARCVLDSGGHGVAGSLSPQGRAVARDRGWGVTGRWAFASGCQQSTWLMAPALLFDGDQPRRNQAGVPQFRAMLVPRDECDVLDTWHTLGMRGTGSHDFTISGAFVPEEYTFDTLAPGRYAGALYRLPVLSALGPGVASCCLGIARGAITELIRLAQEKRPLLSNAPLRERPAVQLQIADAEALVQSAKAFLVQAIGGVHGAAEQGRPPSLEERTQQRLAAWNAARSALKATELAFDAAGSTRSMRRVRSSAPSVTSASPSST